MDQLAACHEQLTRLDAREAAHYTALTALLTGLTATPHPGEDPGGYQPGPPPPWWKLTPDDRREPIARLRAWVEQVYQPGYGHLAATLGPCWPAHDLCLYGLDILAEPVVRPLPAAAPHPRAAVRPGRIPGPHPARPRRPAPAGDRPLRPHPPRHPGPERAMTDATLRQALAYARRGWPVFPCLPGQKIPATTHGFRDATTDEQQITAWFTRHPGRNLAIATGAPGPDVLDVDQHGPDGNGFAAYARLRRAGLLTGASAYVRTPSGGLHAYFTGTSQRNGHLPDHHLDFRSAGGYILAPPSHVGGHPYQLLKTTSAHGTLDWHAVTQLLQPQRQPATAPAPPGPRPCPRRAGPLGRSPARGQPQRRPVLGRQPRPGSRPGRRPEPPGRRRPPRRTRRPGDHPDPGLRPPNRPGPPRPARSPSRGSELT